MSVETAPGANPVRVPRRRAVEEGVQATRRPIPAALRLILPLVLGALLLGLWEAAVVLLQIPKFVLPAPSAIGSALWHDFDTLMQSLVTTLSVTVEAFICAAIGGIAIAILAARSRFFEICVFPYAVVLQVTPIVAIAPLILIWVGLDHVERALLILATIVAFFPILSNTTLGLKSVDPGLSDLMALYGASSWQRLLWVDLPNALPYLLGGMKISGGLALIGAVVAEFVAGSGSGTGLAWRIVESGNRLNIPRMFAALFLLSLLGIAIFLSLSALETLLLRKWHASAVRRDK